MNLFSNGLTFSNFSNIVRPNLRVGIKKIFLRISNKLVAARQLRQFHIFLSFHTFISVAFRLVKETMKIV